MFSAAAINAHYGDDFRRGRELSRDAMQDVGVSPYPAAVLGLNLVFVRPETLAAEFTAASQILDELGADTRAYTELRAMAAGMAAALGNVDLAQQEAGSGF